MSNLPPGYSDWELESQPHFQECDDQRIDPNDCICEQIEIKLAETEEE